jgi:hypothetical protein
MTRTRNTQTAPAAIEAPDDGGDDWGTVEVAASRGRGGGSSATCSISIINDGKTMVIYPSSEISELMTGWEHGAAVAFLFDADRTAIKSIKLSPADGGGLNVRRYRNQNVQVHVKAPGGLVARTDAGRKQTCEHRVEGDAVLVRVPPTISFEAAE